MVMTLGLESWEIHSLRQGCNLYSKHFRICALTVHKVDEIGRRSKDYKKLQEDVNKTALDLISSTTSSSVRSMYFREREKPVVDSDTFLALALPKILMGCLIIFLNGLAILTLLRSNGWIRRRVYFLPSTTQGLLHSLFVTYLLLGLLTLYSQVSLGAWVLAEFRFFDDQQGQECLVVNSALIALSVAVSLHLLSLAVDKILASHLSYNKYSEITKGTVPLWLTAIWLPCGILGALPLAGWRESFGFCIFTEQFNTDYLRFVSGFFLASIIAVPCMYIYFLVFLRHSSPQEGHTVQTLYRWHRKLQSHHKLTFVTILAFNVSCWSPFHIYLLLACPTCLLSSYSSGFLLEYLFVIALLPAIAIPIMFTIRSNVLNQCAGKVSRKTHTNPLSQKSGLFFVDDGTTTTTLSSTLYKDTLSSKKGNFFVPRYLPMGVVADSSSSNTQKSNKYIKNQKGSSRRGGGVVGSGDSSGRRNEGYKSHAEELEPMYANTHTMRSSAAKIKSPPETDSQCGFPIKNVVRPGKGPPMRRQAPPPPTTKPPPPPSSPSPIDGSHYYSTLNH